MYRLFLARRWLATRPIARVTMVGIWLSTMATIVTVAVMSGFLREHERFAYATTADLVVTPRPKIGLDGAALPRPDFETVARALEGAPGIAGLSPRLVRPALLRDEHTTALILDDRKYGERPLVKVIGIDPAREAAATSFRENLERVTADGDRDLFGAAVDDVARPFKVDPRHLPARYRNAGYPVVLVGSRLFTWFALRKGDLLNLVTIPEKSESGDVKPLSERFVVGGALRTGNEQWDIGTVWMERDRARAFSRATVDVSEVCVAVADGEDPEAVALAVRERLAAAGLAANVETWREQNAKILGAVANERTVLGILLFFFVAVACFNVFASLTILVTEKTRDIGVLNALGAPRGGILAIFLGNGLLMAIVAGALGAASGLLLASNLNAIDEAIGRHFGVRLFEQSIFVFKGIPVLVSPGFALVTFFATVAFSLACAFVPARRAARLDPVEALRHD